MTCRSSPRVLCPSVFNIDLANPKMVTAWHRKLKINLLQKRGSRCDCCNEYSHKLDMHEGLVSKQDVRGWKEEERGSILHEYNCVLIDHTHHMDHPPTRQHIFNLQCERYGRNEIERWLESLPFKVPLRSYE